MSPANAGLVPRRKRQQSDVPGLLDGAGQTALVRCAYTGESTRNNLSALGDKLLQQPDVAVGDRIDLFGAKLADLFATEKLTAIATARRPACAPWAGARSG